MEWLYEQGFWVQLIVGWLFVSLVTGIFWSLLVTWMKSERRAKRRRIKAYMKSKAVNEKARWN